MPVTVDAAADDVQSKSRRGLEAQSEADSKLDDIEAILRGVVLKS